MKFTINREDLVRAVTAASRTVNPRSTITLLEGICVEAGEKLRLTGYNLETGITVTAEAKIRETGACVMPCKMFSDIVRKLPDDVVSVEVDRDCRVRIQSGGTSFQFAASYAEDFPALPAVEEEHAIRMPQSALRKLIEGTVFAVSFDGGIIGERCSPILAGGLIETTADSVSMVGCDGYRLAAQTWRAEEARFPEIQFVPPAAALKELGKILEAEGDKEVSFSLSKTHVLFQMEGVTLICRLLEGKYLPWRRFVQPKEQPLRLTADRLELLAAADRASLIVSEKYKSALRCRFGLNGVEMTTTTTVANAADSCRLEGDGKDTEVALSSRFLLEALRAVPTDEVTVLLSGGLRPLFLVPPEEGDGNYVYMINPVRTVPQQ